MQKLLVMLPNNLGDVIMALPVLRALKASDPAPRISFFVEEGYEGGLMESPYCDGIIPFSRKAIRESTRSVSWREGLERLRDIIEGITTEGCDTVINLSQHPYCSFLTSLVKASKISGRRFLREGNHALFDRWSQYLYAIPFARRCNHLHATDVYCRIAGVKGHHEGKYITITEGEKSRAGEFLSGRGVTPERPVAVLQPGAAFASKRWPAEYYRILGGRLVDDGFFIVITGDRSERDYAKEIAEALGESCLLTAGELSFRETIALLVYARCVVSGDTALMHAAAGLGIPVYALFGPTNPVETGPYGSGHVVFAGRCPERPCFKADCESKQCMYAISPDEVYYCIKKGEGQGEFCDVFLTGFKDNAAVLRPLSGGASQLFDKEEAALTRRAFEPEYGPCVTLDATSGAYGKTEAYIDRCREMERTLTAYRTDRNHELLRYFGQLRTAPETGEGIGAFWTALLNIRLNSIPLLDAEKGLGGSIMACRETAEQLESCLG